MRAAVLHGRRDLRIEEVPDPACAQDEIVLAVRAVGICGTDAHEYDAGPHLFPLERADPVTGHVGPMIPGHEFAGEVVEVGAEVRGFEVGDLVSSGAGYSCGECDRCRRGRTNLCRRYATVGLSRDGGLAQFVAVPAAVCRQVAPYGLSADAAALAQPMSIAVHAMRRGRLDETDRALVVGAGGIGAFLIFAASQVTDSVVVTDLDARRLEHAAGLGASTTVLAGTQSFDDAGFTVVYEVSGTASGLRTARTAAGPGARIVLVGLQRNGETPWDLRTMSLVENEVIGTNAHVCGVDLPSALEMLALRRDPWTDLAPEAITLDGLLSEGLQPLVDGSATRIKTLIDPWAASNRPTDMIGGSAR